MTRGETGLREARAVFATASPERRSDRARPQPASKDANSSIRIPLSNGCLAEEHPPRPRTSDSVQAHWQMPRLHAVLVATSPEIVGCWARSFRPVRLGAFCLQIGSCGRFGGVRM